MSRNILRVLVFLTGLLAVGWIGAGYLGTNLPGAAVTLVIGICYLAGALELHRYRQATASLSEAVADVATAQSDLGAWLERLHPSLRNAVRLRVEGERVALPAPSLTPYLVGLLVLLGMLGTLLGMMATLRGTGLALESATDLDAIRGSLGAPVKGLAFAFGTSIAGVASSAMLGLLSALCRRDRLHAVQQLDVQLASTLRPYSHAYQREEAFRLLQQQTGLMPTLIDRLQTMMASLEQHNAGASEQLATRQQEFHARAEASHLQLATSLQQSMTTGMAESAKTLASALQPVVETTLAGLGRESAAMQASVSQAVQQQLDGLSSGLQATTRAAADTWEAAATRQQQTNEALVLDLRGALQQFAETFAQRSDGLLASVSSHIDASTDTTTRAWNQALSQQQAVNEHLAARNEQALARVTETFDQRASALLEVMQQSHTDLQRALESRDEQRLTQWADAFGTMTAALTQHWQQSGEHIAQRQQEICDTLARTAGDVSTQVQGHAAATIAELSRHTQALATAASSFEERTGSMLGVMRQSHTDLQTALESRDEQRLTQWSDALSTITETLGQHWLQNSELVASRQQEICDTLARTAGDVSTQVQGHAADTIAELSRHTQALATAASSFEERTGSLLGVMQQSHTDLQRALESRDEERLTQWADALSAITENLGQHWLQNSDHVASRQQEICDTLARTAHEMSAQAQAHAHDTITEIARLMQAASEAPKAAADVVAELRQKLSDSMVRDNAMLEERSRLLSTLETLLDAVNHASTEQRTAVDALVSTSADLLERVGSRFSDHIEAETGKLGTAAAHISSGAVEVASLGEVFAQAVQQFGTSTEALNERLQVIESALEKSLARSDEQLGYYVAQAREVIDLSMLSQKQIIGELQKLADSRSLAGA
ncbi:MAG: DUF802 domain-containing protein [Stenotrophomonas sp.]